MVISIFKFLREYYGITLDAGCELTHAVAKRNFKLKGCPFWYAKANPDLIQEGKIIYVSDTHGVILPYMCPEKIKASVSDVHLQRQLTKKKY